MGGREKQRVDGRKNREPLGEALAKISISRMWGQGPELRSGERGPGSGPHPAAELTNPWARKLSRARRPGENCGPGTEGAAAPQPGSPAPTGSEPRWPWLSGLRGRPFRGPTEPEEGEGLNLLPSAVPLP